MPLVFDYYYLFRTLELLHLYDVGLESAYETEKASYVTHYI